MPKTEKSGLCRFPQCLTFQMSGPDGAAHTTARLCAAPMSIFSVIIE